ncbi:SDR family oxidoreductase [Nosocomiicoccus massiliensis]|uniref:SDR family oxidoreductase n=1 Tax=Nosocomiicoccus massiliensis TaxID=1232430 RepID=UPI0003F537CB|nr:SDR family oxidoreductase [Nosocomiicoccus massiliensis]
MNLTGKTAIVTGGNGGIGLAIAKRLVEEGANVTITGRSEDKLQSALKELKSDHVLALKTDVSKFDDVKQLVDKTKEKFGEIDIYVNNAGLMKSSRVTDGDVESWSNMIDTNIKGILYGVHHVVSDMKERGSGHIINTTSVSAHEVTKQSTVYSATKIAALTIGQGLEKELALTGVRVTSISPGMVDTRLAENVKSDRKKLEARDIANAVIYALTQPDYVNVNEIIVRPV